MDDKNQGNKASGIQQGEMPFLVMHAMSFLIYLWSMNILEFHFFQGDR